MRDFIYIFIFLCLPFLAASQEYNHYSFNDLYDFEIETVYDLYQDKSANIWFGTNEGLVKFNGVDFTYFVHDSYRKSSTNIKEDAQGRIWFSNFGGQLFRVENDKLTVIVEECPGSGFIDDFHVDEDAVFFTSTKGALVKKNLKTKVQTEIKLNGKGLMIESTANKEEFLLIVLATKIDIGKRKTSLWSYNYATGKQKEKATDNLSIVSSKHDLILDGDAVYFWRSNYNFEMIEIREGKMNQLFSSEKIQMNEINSIDVNDGILEIKTKSGMFWMDRSGKAINTKKSLEQFSISETMYDIEGNLWVSTLNDGIQIIPNKEFTNIDLSDIEVSNTCNGENGDLYLIDVKGAFFKISPPYNNVVSLGRKDLNIGGEIAYNPADKCVYFSFSNYYFDTQSSSFKDLAQNNRIKLGARKMAFINSEEVLLCSYSSTRLMNLKGNSLSVQGLSYPGRVFSKGAKELRNENSYSVAVEKNTANLYVGYNDGVYMHSQNKSYEILDAGEHIIASEIVQAKASGVWISTNNKRLLKVVSGKVTYSIDLPDLVRNIVEWNGVLFLATKKSVYRLDVASKSLSLVDASDGLLKERIVDVYIDDNSLIIIGKNHLQKIPCSFMGVNNTPPRLRIESVLLFEKEVHKGDYDFGFNENYITINFSATAIRSQGKCKYLYRLNKGDWIETSANAPLAIFPKLAPGNYAFEVRAINEDGTSSATQRISFSIDKHFTQKWWFIALVLLGIILVVFFITRNRLIQLRKHSDLEIKHQQLRKEVYKSKIAALRAQMNPHFMFNALNTIQEFILTNQKEVASEYLADFADLMRKYLEQSKQEEISLSDEIETLEIYLGLENLRTDGQLNYSISCEPTLNPYEIKIPVMLLQPYIENSIKHGLLHIQGEKKLSISFNKISDQRFQCRIEDNGIGRAASTTMKQNRSGGHSSFATEAMDQKMELVNKSSSKDMSIEIVDLETDGQASGTLIILEVDC